MMIDQAIKYAASQKTLLWKRAAKAVSFMMGICAHRLENHYLMIPDIEDCICTICFFLYLFYKSIFLLSVQF